MLDELFARLRGSDSQDRDRAVEELGKAAFYARFTLDDAVRMLDAIVHEFGGSDQHSVRVAEQLALAVGDIGDDSRLSMLRAPIERLMPRVAPKVQSALLCLLTRTHTVEAAELYVRFLRDHGASLSGEHVYTFSTSVAATIAEALFPSALEGVRYPAPRGPVLRMLYDMRNAGLVSRNACAGHEERLVDVLRRELASIRLLQRPTGVGWKDDDAYWTHRWPAGVLFDLAGMLDCAPLLDEVAASGNLLDSCLRRSRAVSMLKQGRDVPDEELEWIAGWPKDRYLLFDELGEIGHAHRRPAACLDQALLAEGNMVDWLARGTELEREPDEIELLEIVSGQSIDAGASASEQDASADESDDDAFDEGELLDFYFFKFRVLEEHWSTEDGWMVGMAGGYRRRDQPTTDGSGDTVSRFEPLDAKTLDEHIEDYLR